MISDEELDELLALAENAMRPGGVDALMDACDPLTIRRLVQEVKDRRASSAQKEPPMRLSCE